ncbi:MAG: serine hydrolase domain-containing protein [Bacteroidales bacterium]|jgi:D-alanyl-D-alanine carboxypeptidase
MKKNLFFFTAIVLSGALLISSCKHDPGPDPNQEQIDQMKTVTDSIIANTHVPGIVALVVDHKKEINWLYAAGLSDIPAKAPMNANYTFRVGSNTKTFVGTVLLQLVNEGKIQLNDRLSKYYPDYPKSDSITITMLCNMTSGIFNYTDAEEWVAQANDDPFRVWTPKELVDLGMSKDFYFQPGTGWTYSNTNTFIIGMIIEKITGHTLQSEIENRIIKPLQLTNTGFITSGPDLPGLHGRGYYSGEYVENEDMTEAFDLSWAWAAGSVYSTPRELQKYVETLVWGGFLPDSLQHRRLNDMINIAEGIDYGLCLARRGTFYGHNGGMPGFTSSMYHSNERDCTVIIYFNCDIEAPEPIVPDMLLVRFLNILYGLNP